MSLNPPTPALVQQLTSQLRERQMELRTLLQAANGAAMADEAAGDVLDFKDVAAEDTRAVVDEVAHAHAAEELAQIAAALRRVDAGSYGQCEDCGDPIDERRLRALPGTPFCTACQAIHERPGRRR
jgi:DnaK suppressor protein